MQMRGLSFLHFAVLVFVLGGQTVFANPYPSARAAKSWSAKSCAALLAYERIEEPVLEPHVSVAQFVAALKELGMDQDPLVQKAFLQAIRSHKNQRRDDGSNYLEQHILPVTLSVIREVLSPGSSLREDSPDLRVIIAAALLHDALEDDPNLTHDRFIEEFGPEVYAIVEPLTKPDFSEFPGHSKRAQKFNLNWPYIDRIGQQAPVVRIIKLADRLNNLISSRNAVYKSLLENPNQTIDEKVAYYIAETERFYVPMAQVTSYYYFMRLSYHLDRLKPLVPDWDRVRSDVMSQISAPSTAAEESEDSEDI